MISLKPKAAVEPVTFAQAPRFHANGYEPCNMPWGASMPGGAWGVGYHYRDSYAATYSGDAVSILCGVRPVTGAVALDACKSTWLAALRVQIFSDKGLAKAVDELVKSRLRWWNVGTTLSPVRLDVDGTRSTLRVFQLDAAESAPIEPQSMKMALGYVMPGDPAPEKRYLRDYRANSASWISAVGQIPYSADTKGRPYEWTDGGLLGTPRAALPVIDAGCAHAMLADIEQLMASRDEPWI